MTSHVQQAHGVCDLLHAHTRCSNAPMQVCVGFGVSRPEHVTQIMAWGAEGVICGSALVKALGESGSAVRDADVQQALLSQQHG